MNAQSCVPIKALFIDTEIWLSHTFHMSWNIILLLIYSPQPFTNAKTILGLWLWKTGSGPDLPHRSQLAHPCSKPTPLTEKSGHHGAQIPKESEPSTLRFIKIWGSWSFQMTYISLSPPTLLCLSSSLPLKHASPEIRGLSCHPIPRQAVIPALWFLGASGFALWYHGEAEVLCHPPGTPPSLLAPNFALSSAESKNFNRDAPWSLLCLKRFIKGAASCFADTKTVSGDEPKLTTSSWLLIPVFIL